MDMNEIVKTIFGIVVGQVGPGKAYYVWCKDTYIGRDGIIHVSENQKMNLGDWVTVSFTKQEAEKFFPLVPNPYAPRFESRNFQNIPEIYKTMVSGKKIRVAFDYHLNSNQTVIDHHFFGEIFNDRYQTRDGLFKLTICRIKPDERVQRRSVWALDQFDPIERPVEHIKTIIGIVVSVSKNNSETIAQVWCKERISGFDGTIEFRNGQECLALGEWVQMTFTQEEYAEYTAESVEYDLFCVKNYKVIPPIHETVVRGNGIELKLECHVEGGRDGTRKHIPHPFIGIIINEIKSIYLSGKYFIKIVSNANAGKCVWLLQYIDMMEPAAIEPEIRPASVPIMPQSSSVGWAGVPSNTPQQMRSEMSTLGTTLTRESELIHIQLPPASMFRMISSMSNLQISAQTHNQNQNAPSTSGLPPPSRASLPSGEQKIAMIVKIEKKENYELIFVWLMTEHKSAVLKLQVPAEKLDLKQGDVFKAVFQKTNDNFSSYGPPMKVEDPIYSYQTRSGPHLEVRIYSEMVYAEDQNHPHQRVYHDHFGDIIDNFNQLSQTHSKIKRHLWIKKMKRMDSGAEWVVVEEIVV